MFEPCYEHCYIKYGKQYPKECDNECIYAKTAKNSRDKDEIIEYLLDMLEEEHMGMRAVAIKEIADEFNIEL